MTITDYIYDQLLDEVIDQEDKRKEISQMSEAIRMRPWKEQKDEYINQIRTKGMEEGLEKGKVIGIEEGLEKGKVIGLKEARIDIVEKMIKKGFDYEEINSIVKISLEEYQDLKSKL